MSDVNRNITTNDRLDEEGESSVASVEEQRKKEMTVYEVWLQRIYELMNKSHIQVFTCSLYVML